MHTIKAPKEFDAIWVENAFQHVIWKLSTLRHAEPNMRSMYLSAQNIVYHVMKKYNKEFVQGKQSFFQRVLQEDEQIQRHFVGVVAAIK